MVKIPAAPNNVSYQPGLKEARILVIDDVPANVKLVEGILRSDGYTRLLSTVDSRQAIDLYRQQGSDLILLDLNMPHMDGFEVIDAFKSLDSGYLPPVLVLTAQSEREYRLRALESGARDYVTKPFDRAELLARVRTLLEVELSHKAIRSQNEILEQVVLERTRELRDTQLEIVRRLGRAAEYRDNETGLHIIRMSKISALLGTSAGMNSVQVRLLLNASPMHDVGKIGIPDQILLKPGKLEPHEWEIMKTHAAIGAEILSGHHSELMEMAATIALTHHEKWDGSGYPQGLRGDAIPLVGRIVALADVFDALTSERPYKSAWTVDDAVTFIRENAGTHFDPRLVEHFVDLLPEILAIKEAYAEPGQSGETSECTRFTPSIESGK